jgi:hypothetical protein
VSALRELPMGRSDEKSGSKSTRADNSDKLKICRKITFTFKIPLAGKNYSLKRATICPRAIPALGHLHQVLIIRQAN